MTALLEEVLKHIKELPEKQQESIATQLMDLLDDEKWKARFDAAPDVLDSLEEEALAEYARGEAKPLEDSL